MRFKCGVLSFTFIVYQKIDKNKNNKIAKTAYCFFVKIKKTLYAMRAKNTKLSLKLSWFAALKSLQKGVSKSNDGLLSKSFAANGFN